jgi:hypothetical protein
MEFRQRSLPHPALASFRGTDETGIKPSCPSFPILCTLLAGSSPAGGGWRLVPYPSFLNQCSTQRSVAQQSPRYRPACGQLVELTHRGGIIGEFARQMRVCKPLMYQDASITHLDKCVMCYVSQDLPHQGHHCRRPGLPSCLCT